MRLQFLSQSIHGQTAAQEVPVSGKRILHSRCSVDGLGMCDCDRGILEVFLVEEMYGIGQATSLSRHLVHTNHNRSSVPDQDVVGTQSLYVCSSFAAPLATIMMLL